jgi:hypothetical protein
MASIVKTKPDPLKEKASLSWKENPAAKKLLDALVSILVKKYTQVAKENPEIFSE